jgi:hypothetical protein
MKNQIEELFAQARQTESELPADAFLTQVRCELLRQSVKQSKQNFDWILVLAAVLASSVVFFLTPLYGWLLALPAVLPTIGNMQLVILATALATISFFVFFDWEFE